MKNSSISDLFEKLAKLTGILAFFGYASLKAHLNHLGIYSRSSLGAERYLMEIYNVIASISLGVVFMIVGIVLLSILIYLIIVLAKKKQSAYGIYESLSFNLSKFLSSPLGPLFPTVVLIVTYICIIKILSEHGTDIVLGKLTLDKLIDAQCDSWFFYIVLLICSIGYCVFKKLTSHSDSSSNFIRVSLRTCFGIFLILVTLYLPIIYGSLNHSVEYPVVKVFAKGEGDPPLSGLLVLETPTNISLWRAEQGIGKVITMERSHIQSIVSYDKYVSILTVARIAFQESKLDLPDDRDKYSE